MVSKHSAVRSIRLQNTDWEWLSAEAEKRGTTVNGLVAEGVGLLRRPLVVTIEGGGGSMLPEPERSTTTAVPVFQRKAFNPQPKAGKKPR